MLKFFSFFKPVNSGKYWCGLCMMVFGVAQIAWQLVTKSEPMATTMVIATKDLGVHVMAAAGVTGSMIPSMGIMGGLMLMVGCGLMVHGILQQRVDQDRMRGKP